MKGHIIYTSLIKPEIQLISQQNNYAFDSFKQLLSNVKPSRILEIGTSAGGTILFIREFLDSIGLSKTKIKSFDMNNKDWYEELRKRNIEVIVENIFSHSYREIEKPNLVEPYIKLPGTTIVLCDGGSKINEFKILSQYLKKGDIIMAHDYVDNEDNFLKNYKDKIWNWREIGDEHINESCQKFNLKPFMQDIFDKSVWVCKIKE